MYNDRPNQGARTYAFLYIIVGTVLAVNDGLIRAKYVKAESRRCLVIVVQGSSEEIRFLIYELHEIFQLNLYKFEKNNSNFF